MAQSVITADRVAPHNNRLAWFKDQVLMGQTTGEYLRSLVTPFNAIASVIVAVGFYLSVKRFTQGMAATTNLSDTNPWGLWIGFDVMVGVALAAGAYTLGTAVYIFGLKDYHSIMRATILTGFLGYAFAVLGLLYDLGRPWRLPYPMTISFGFTSVLFLIAWHFASYLTCLFLEFVGVVLEWLGARKLRAWTAKILVGVIIAGAFIATLHQAGLGALFLLMPGKLHPLWYSPLLPLYFFVSSIIAGLSMIIVESSLTHRIFRKQLEDHGDGGISRLTFGLGKATALILFAYFWLKVMGIIHDNAWDLLSTPYGYWFLVELIVFVQLPSFLFLWGAQYESLLLVRIAAVVTVLGIAVNRLNVAVIAFNWNVPDRYFPAWSEIWVTVAIITTGVLTFRWIVNRMPVLREHPDFKD